MKYLSGISCLFVNKLQSSFKNGQRAHLIIPKFQLSIPNLQLSKMQSINLYYYKSLNNIFYKIFQLSFPKRILHQTNLIIQIMSEEYEDYGDYDQYANDDNVEQAEQQEDQDYQTKVELDFFEAEELYRNNQTDKCISSLEELYTMSTQKQLKNWKVKILNLLLQIYCRSNDNAKIKQALERISELNKKQKYTETAIKSIILTIKSLPNNIFNANKDYVYGFLNQLDNLGKIRSYLLFLEKAVEQNDLKEADHLFKIINQILNDTTDVPSSNLIQLFSFEIRHSKKTHKDISKQIRKMQLKLPALQAESYNTEGHICIIKEAVAQKLYVEDNFIDCATYLCQAFQDNMKYGKSSEVKKNLLKTNCLISLLIQNKQLFTNQKHNALYHESASSFKGQNDIQCLYGLVTAYTDDDLNGFEQQIKMAQLNLSAPYGNLQKKVKQSLKMNKLLKIIKPYNKVKVSYLERRLNSSKKQVQTMLFNMITDNKIKGRLRFQSNETYLDVDRKEDQFLKIQLENIKEISKRYL